ncbi:G2/M phase-specific E3 ubiquitin-protein ligase-like [Misgurnus anguillicaudatus]|uniref:G2/M phase-specific E3 ubiquitin-protein ligase-like n=1 Tax=Misgurnus anguillicaudatus TaxID=75329 RepID=UPI003CCF5086
MFFTYDQSSVEMRRYYIAGKLISWSLMHGGPGVKALDTTLFKLMCGQKVTTEDFDWHDLPDSETQDKARQVYLCQTQDELNGIQSSLSEWIADCGVPGIYSAKPKDMRRIYGQVIKHYMNLRTADMINQFKDGMNSCGNLWKVVERNWKVFLPVFTNQQKPLSREDFRALFTISWSEEGSNLKDKEEDTIFCWELLLNKIQGGLVAADTVDWYQQTRWTGISRHDTSAFESLLTQRSGSSVQPTTGFTISTTRALDTTPVSNWFHYTAYD